MSGYTELQQVHNEAYVELRKWSSAEPEPCSTEHINEVACEALTRAGVSAVQLVPEDEAARVCQALGNITPCTEVGRCRLNVVLETRSRNPGFETRAETACFQLLTL